VAEQDRTPIALELDRAIVILKRGLKEHWATRGQYLAAFERTPVTDSANRPVTDSKNYVECAIGARFRDHQVWDEGVPIEVEVQNTIDDFMEWREKQTTARLPMPCGMPTQHKVTVTAGVAETLLRVKTDPIYTGRGAEKARCGHSHS
jgi:hypothetical protein